eukprot:123653-Hanusia_phi.AAC.1
MATLKMMEMETVKDAEVEMVEVVEDHNYDEAVRDYRKVMELMPGRDEVSDKLNEALRMQSMWKTNRDHKYQRAGEGHEKAGVEEMDSDCWSRQK